MGLKGGQPQVLRIGLGVWKTPSVAVLLKSLWGLPSSKMDSAMGRRCLLKFWLVEAGSPATLSSSAMSFHASQMHAPTPLWVFFFLFNFPFSVCNSTSQHCSHLITAVTSKLKYTVVKARRKRPKTKGRKKKKGIRTPLGQKTSIPRRGRLPYLLATVSRAACA